MKSIGNLISASRKNKNLTQEQLAEMSKVTLRTIQRIENNENTPRGYTLNAICDALNLDLSQELEIKNNTTYFNNVVENTFNIILLIIFNLIFNFILGWLTLDSEANNNSRLGAILLSFFVPIFIVFFTLKMPRSVRLIKFGTGFFLYTFLILYLNGFPLLFFTGLLLCFLIALLTLWFGDKMINVKNYNI